MSKPDDSPQKFIEAVIEEVKKRERRIQVQPTSVVFRLEEYPEDAARLRPGSTNDAPGKPIPGCAALELPCTPGTIAPYGRVYGTGQTFLTEGFSANTIKSCADLIIQALCKNR